jgi:hypothetical protein
MFEILYVTQKNSIDIDNQIDMYKMLLTYYEPDLQDYIELFEQYWELLRGKKQNDSHQ